MRKRKCAIRGDAKEESCLVGVVDVSGFKLSQDAGQGRLQPFFGTGAVSSFTMDVFVVHLVTILPPAQESVGTFEVVNTQSGSKPTTPMSSRKCRRYVKLIQLFAYAERRKCQRIPDVKKTLRQ